MVPVGCPHPLLAVDKYTAAAGRDSNLALGVIPSLARDDQSDNHDFHGCDPGKIINNFTFPAIAIEVLVRVAL